MSRIFFIVTLFISITFELSAQCNCTDCDVPIMSQQVTQSILTISGASGTNDSLGIDGQLLTNICLNFVHDAPEEVRMTLIAPNGSFVDIMQNTGISVNDDITFDICFSFCGGTVNPDPGFNPVFDSSEDWIDGVTYCGCYFPSGGACLETLSGPVNGDWTLQMEDFIFADDGTLFNWYLVFADNNGTNCTDDVACAECCNANGGLINSGPDVFCENDPTAILSPTATYIPASSEPPAVTYGYTYVVVEVGGPETVLSISNPADLTSLPIGSYAVCGLSYLLDDEPLLPIPDGSLSIPDINLQISNEVFCGDFSTNCRIVEIVGPPPKPDVTGPDDVCADQQVSYLVNNGGGSFITTVNITQGNFSSLDVIGNEIQTIWTDGPGQICITYENACGTMDSCIDVVVNEFISVDMITPADPVCAGATETYVFSPDPVGNQAYQFTIVGGTIVSDGLNQVTVIWDGGLGNGEVCAQLFNAPCGVPGECNNIVFFNSALPNQLTVDDEFCLDENGTASVPDNPNILNYSWSGTGITFISGQNDNSTTFSFDQTGTVSVCLDIETDCGFEGPLCQDIEVYAVPDPSIDGPTEICGTTFFLEGTQLIGGLLNWFLLSSPGPAVISNPFSQSTQIDITAAGEYVFQLREINGICTTFADHTIEILPPLDVLTTNLVCDDQQMYTVSFEILTGQAPYTVDGNPINGNTFTSPPINSGANYNFEIEDALGCISVQFGSFNCACTTNAGTTTGGPENVCVDVNNQGFVTLNGDFVFDPNDIDVFVLHDGSVNVIGNILLENQTGIFSYLPDLDLGVTYYISYLVGNDDGGGSVDQNDPCFSFTPGQPVTFYQTPSLTVAPAAEVCGTNIFVDGTVDPIDANLIWQQISGPGNISFTGNDFPLEVSVNAPGEYAVEFVASNPGCSIRDTLELTFFDIPTILEVQQNCANDLQTYSVTVELAGGTPPYTASLSGTFTANIFESDPIPSGQAYSLSITDANQCDVPLIQGNENCGCETNAGLMSADTLRNCGTTGSLQANHLGGENLDIDDISEYIFYTDKNDVIGSVIDQNNTGIFSFQNGMVLNQIYFVSLAVGNNVGAQVDLLDICTAITAGQPMIWHDLPDIVDLTTNCTPLGDVFTVNFIIMGGQGPFLADFPGNVTGDLFASDPIVSGGSYDIQITDANGCRSERVTGVVNCIAPDCTTNAGTVQDTALLPCDGDEITIDISNGDFNLDSNDVIRYVLHTSSTDTLGDILYISRGENIPFDPTTIVFDSVYFLSVMVGDSLLNGDIFLGDSCFSMTVGVPVIWRSLTIIDLQLDSFDGCWGDTAFVPYALDGPLPVFLSLSNGVDDTIQYVLLDAVGVLKIPVRSDTSFYKVIRAEGICAVIPEDSIWVAGKIPESIDVIIDWSPKCVQDSYYLMNVFLDISEGIEGVWTFPPAFQVVNDTVYFYNAPPGDYAATFSNIGFADPCPGFEYTTQLILIDCACLSPDLPPEIVVCTVDSVDLNALELNGISGVWSLENINNEPSPPMLLNDSVLITEANFGEYVLHFVATGLFPDCPDSFSFPLRVSETIRNLEQIEFPQVCRDQEIVWLTGLIPSTDLFVQWYDGPLPLFPFITLTNKPDGPVFAQFIADGEYGCPNIEGEVEILLNPNPNIEITPFNISCFNADDGEIVIEIEDLADGPYDCFVNDVLVTSKELENLPPGSYRVFIENSYNCISDTLEVQLSAPEPLTVSLGDNQEVMFDDTLTIQAILSVLNPELSEIQWSDLDGLLPEEDLELIRSFAMDNQINILIEDENGCIARDSILITVRQEEIPANIFIPNILISNGNSANSQFRLFSNGFVTRIDAMEIFDRWGNKVFAAYDKLPDDPAVFWDGRFDSVPLQSAVFVYHVIYTTVEGDQDQQSGDVLLLR